MNGLSGHFHNFSYRRECEVGLIMVTVRINKPLSKDSHRSPVQSVHTIIMLRLIDFNSLKQWFPKCVPWIPGVPRKNLGVPRDKLRIKIITVYKILSK